ncbi:hypothetical protein HK098_002585 [Nowakowskiella sp. JEL0407]|nr:hypothetical protein HK098_002585 [Nowakowskiella sp. JEL0407]
MNNSMNFPERMDDSDEASYPYSRPGQRVRTRSAAAAAVVSNFSLLSSTSLNTPHRSFSHPPIAETVEESPMQSVKHPTPKSSWSSNEPSASSSSAKTPTKSSHNESSDSLLNLDEDDYLSQVIQMSRQHYIENIRPSSFIASLPSTPEMSRASSQAFSQISIDSQPESPTTAAFTNSSNNSSKAVRKLSSSESSLHKKSKRNSKILSSVGSIFRRKSISHDTVAEESDITSNIANQPVSSLPEIKITGTTPTSPVYSSPRLRSESPIEDESFDLKSYISSLPPPSATTLYRVSIAKEYLSRRYAHIFRMISTATPQQQQPRYTPNKVPKPTNYNRYNPLLIVRKRALAWQRDVREGIVDENVRKWKMKHYMWVVGNTELEEAEKEFITETARNIEIFVDDVDEDVPLESVHVPDVSDRSDVEEHVRFDMEVESKRSSLSRRTSVVEKSDEGFSSAASPEPGLTGIRSATLAKLLSASEKPRNTANLTEVIDIDIEEYKPDEKLVKTPEAEIITPRPQMRGVISKWMKKGNKFGSLSGSLSDMDERDFPKIKFDSPNSRDELMRIEFGSGLKSPSPLNDDGLELINFDDRAMNRTKKHRRRLLRKPFRRHDSNSNKPTKPMLDFKNTIYQQYKSLQSLHDQSHEPNLDHSTYILEGEDYDQKFLVHVSDTEKSDHSEISALAEYSGVEVNGTVLQEEDFDQLVLELQVKVDGISSAVDNVELRWKKLTDNQRETIKKYTGENNTLADPFESAILIEDVTDTTIERLERTTTIDKELSLQMKTMQHEIKTMETLCTRISISHDNIESTIQSLLQEVDEYTDNLSSQLSSQLKIVEDGVDQIESLLTRNEGVFGSRIGAEVYYQALEYLLAFLGFTIWSWFQVYKIGRGAADTTRKVIYWVSNPKREGQLQRLLEPPLSSSETSSSGLQNNGESDQSANTSNALNST